MSRTQAKTVWGNFESAADTPKHRIIWRSWGAEKTGKNELGLSAPGPIAIHCLDILGLEGVVEKHRQRKDIYVRKYRWNKNADNNQEQAIDIRDQFLEDIKVSMQNARTVQVDETEMWEVFRYAEFGDKSDNPSGFDKLYADYRAWIHEFDNCDCNLQLIQKQKEKWERYDATDNNGRKKEKGRPTGTMVSSGYKDLCYIVKMNINHRWSPESGFQLYVENCTYNMDLAGLELPGMPFGDLAQLVFPESDESDWQ